MRRPLRVLAAVAVATTVLLGAGPAAVAAPGHGTGHVKVHVAAKGGAKSGGLVAKLVAKAERALDRAVRPSRTARLSAESVAALQANVDADKALLATYTTREELAGFRTVNYVLVVNVLRQAEATGLDDVVAEALTVTATTPKADVTALLGALESVE